MQINAKIVGHHDGYFLDEIACFIPFGDCDTNNSCVAHFFSQVAKDEVLRLKTKYAYDNVTVEITL